MRPYERYYIKEHMKGFFTIIPLFLLILPGAIELVATHIFHEKSTTVIFSLFVELTPIFLTLESLTKTSLFGYIQFGNRAHGYLKPVTLMMLLDSIAIGFVGSVLYAILLSYADKYPILNSYNFFNILDIGIEVSFTPSVSYCFFTLFSLSLLVNAWIAFDLSRSRLLYYAFHFKKGASMKKLFRAITFYYLLILFGAIYCFLLQIRCSLHSTRTFTRSFQILSILTNPGTIFIIALLFYLIAFYRERKKRELQEYLSIQP